MDLIDEELNALLWLAYFLGDVVTFVYLTLQWSVADSAWWQWCLHLVLSFVVAQAWPLYWAVLHWI
ncbi:MAG: hypothetical protein U1E45_12300 [Geminicoccaceae bacterium]